MNKKLKCQLCGKFSTKNWLTSHIDRKHQSLEPNVLENVNNNNKILLLEKRNNDNNPNASTNENHALVVICPRNVGKTYYMLKMLAKKVTKDLFFKETDDQIKIRIMKQVMKLNQ